MDLVGRQTTVKTTHKTFAVCARKYTSDSPGLRMCLTLYTKAQLNSCKQTSEHVLLDLKSSLIPVFASIFYNYM